MLYRKIEDKLTEYFNSDSNKILLIDGARQIGKTYIIRYLGTKMFENYIELNMVEDFIGNKLFKNVNTIDDFYLQVSMIAGEKMKKKEKTLIFLDEIQVYPHLLTLLKFLKKDNKFTYIASGSLLGVTLSKTTSIPIGSIEILKMYPLDFEEFLYANGFNNYAINSIKNSLTQYTSLNEENHNKLIDLFKKYLLVGGLPDAVNSFLKDKNIVKLRQIQNDILEFYKDDASKYDPKNKLKIRRIYDMIPSTLENKKKRIIIKDIEYKENSRFSEYHDEFDYLINAGIALDVNSISNPVFPLKESERKNLLKLYLNDVGLLSNILYKNNIRAILEDTNSINLGSIYESVVASELKAHGHNLYYYDNRKKGEVDFLIDDFDNLSILPIEIKSGKDYQRHVALSKFMNNKYNAKKAYVLSNSREIKINEKIIYMPIYFAMFL